MANPNNARVSNNAPQVEEMGFNVQEEIDKLEDIIFSGTRIPLLGKTLIDEEAVINQLDLIRLNLPDCIEQAIQILQQRQKILAEAQKTAQSIIENAQRKASQLLDESRIIQQAESQAAQIRRQVQQDCENLQRKTLAEVEQLRQKLQEEARQIRQQAIAEAEEIQNEADKYADQLLARLERDLTTMLRIVTNGRQEIHQQKLTANTNSPSLQKKAS